MSCRTVLAAGFALLLASTYTVAADLHYRLTDIGDLTTSRSSGVTFVAAIGENGEIVGQSFNNQFRARAFLWQSGRMTDLGDFGNLNGQPPSLSAFAMNKRLEIVGTAMGAMSSSPVRGFLWQKKRVADLGTLRGMGTDTFATGINEHGDIVGAGYRSPGDLRALIWVRGQPTELGAATDGRVAVQAFGINDHGDIVGYLSPGGTARFAHAFIWTKGKFTDLGTLPGTTLSFANAVNEHRQVVGQSLNTAVPGTSRAFLWEEGTLLDLGKAAASHKSSEARAINDKGVVVGTSGTSSAALAWIWRDGVTQDLNTLVAADDPNRPYVRLTKATGINEKGQIAAQGYDRRRGSSFVRGYLLTPGNR